MSSLVKHTVNRLFQTTAKSPIYAGGPPLLVPGHEGGYKLWRSLSLFVAFPVILLCAANCYFMALKHPHERPPFVKYEYLRLRSKRFPWGDGTRSLFHNPHVNPLPDGYEDEIEE